jgi:hypothetical protein
MDVTEVKNKIRLRKEKTDDGREIGAGSQASQFTSRKIVLWEGELTAPG